METSLTERTKSAEAAVAANPGSGALTVATAYGRQQIRLDGVWQFRPGDGTAMREISVPGCWESQFTDLRGWAGSATYERTFIVPESFRGRRVLLDFDAVDYYTEAWVNGRHVGTHEG